MYPIYYICFKGLRGNVWENQRGKKKFKIQCILKVCVVKLSINEYFQWPEYEHRLRWQVGAPLWFSQTLPLKSMSNAGPALDLDIIVCWIKHRRLHKECVARMTCLYKNNGAVSCVGGNVLFIWTLYLPIGLLLEIRLPRNKKEYLSKLNCRKYVIL